VEDLTILPNKYFAETNCRPPQDVGIQLCSWLSGYDDGVGHGGKNCSIDVLVYQCKQIAAKLAAKARVDVKELLKTGPKEQVLDSRRKV